MNRLANESSLYLRQHANNPVDWHPWGDEAIARARELDKPIFLSIGYSACHWCHVMEHESFEDEATAALLNEHFICIKVDREERPDIDHIYMTALQAMTREGGGWPLSVWLTPDLHPFYAGTYYPPDDRYAPQRPSFKQLLRSIAEAWRERRSEITEQSAAITTFLQQQENQKPASSLPLTDDLLRDAERALQQGFDPVNGGFGNAPKFPHALELRLLLRLWKRNRQDVTLHVIRLSLDKMAAGGIYDQIGGGFHRYSTDARWLVPHFEKMLYDNALLTSAYVDAWLATKDAEYHRVAEETLDYVLREMTSPVGAFFSTQDADSENEEGKFYVWSLAEIEEVLDPAESKLFDEAFGVTRDGNFEGQNILHRVKPFEQLAQSRTLPIPEFAARIKSCSQKLYDVRKRRVWPGRDEKILTSWNALMIAAFAQAGSAFDEGRYVMAAVKAAEFVVSQMLLPDGALMRTCAVGSAPRIKAYLEDYAFLIDALVDVYQATFEPRWVEHALRLGKKMIAQFADTTNHRFFSTSDEHQHLIARTKDSYDGSTPSSNSMAVQALLRLADLTQRDEFRRHAEESLRSFASFLKESGRGHAQMLAAVDYSLGPVFEIVIVGSAKSPDTQRAFRLVRQSYLPNKIVLFHDESTGRPDVTLLPLLDGNKAGPEVRTFICTRGTCLAPLEGVEALEKWLGANA